MQTMEELGCTGEFGCDCPKQREQKKLLSKPQHGERRKYQQGCRCKPCTNANAEYQQTYREGYHRGTA